MTLYIVQSGYFSYDCETEFLSIWDTEEKANAEKERLEKKREKLVGEFADDDMFGYRVIEVELNKPSEDD